MSLMISTSVGKARAGSFSPATNAFSTAREGGLHDVGEPQPVRRALPSCLLTIADVAKNEL
jgi:hypothetical protein